MTEILKNFWVIEGLDGAGTTTQLKLLSQELTDRQIPFHSTQEPTANETGKLIRRILSGEVKVDQSTIAYMFAADRNDHLNNPEYGIMNHLKKGETVMSDRYFFSSFAYQTIGFSWEEVEKLNSAFPYPQYVIYVDTPVDDCIKRISSRGLSPEIYEKYEYQKLVSANYEKCLGNLPQGCTLIKVDGTLPKEVIKQKIVDYIF